MTANKKIFIIIINREIKITHRTKNRILKVH
jgi:hypothetical protein